MATHVPFIDEETLMATHSAPVLALPIPPEERQLVASKEFMVPQNRGDNIGALKRFERFISPFGAVNTFLPEDYHTAGLIMRNSWLR